MSNNIVQQFQGELTVSSEIVAERTENEHASVLRLVRNNQTALEEFGDLRFEILDRPGVPGPPQQVAHLNEQQATLLITFMRNSPVVVAFKVELVKQFYAMRQALARPKSLAERSLEIVGELHAEVQKQAAEIAVMAPKADYVDTFVADSDLRLFRNVAKSLGMQEQALRADLVARKWIYHEKSTRWSEKEQKKVPHDRYSAYADKTRYFTPVPTHDAPRFRGEVMHTLKITPAGAVAIARLYGKHLALVVA